MAPRSGCSYAPAMSHPVVQRLNWGCGPRGVPGWLNSDLKSGSGIDFPCDIRDGLPIESGSLDYIASIHALQEIPLDDQVPVLKELHRMLRRDGVLRLCLPDADKAIRAYLNGDRGHFVVPDEDYSSLGGKFVVHILWYGHSRVMYTPDFISELLGRTGFTKISHCRCHESASTLVGITDLDSRPRESLFVEAVK